MARAAGGYILPTPAKPLKRLPTGPNFRPIHAGGWSTLRPYNVSHVWRRQKGDDAGRQSPG